MKISLDPNADVLVTARGPDVRDENGVVKRGRTKTVYSDAWDDRQAATKFARSREGLLKKAEMANEIQEHRSDPKQKENAECAWLMQVQATRPGSEADNKDTARFFDRPITSDSVVVEKDKVSLRIDGELVPVKNKKTKAELLRRMADREPLLDSTFWLKSHGATTLEGRHVVEKEDGVYLQFVGKESVYHSHRIHDPELAKMLLGRKATSGDRGKLFGTNYDKVTAYTSSLDGGKFTPKDFRTVRACELAIEIVKRMDPPGSEKARRAAIMKVGTMVSQLLGNEPSQCLTSYIDPAVFSVWQG